MGGELETIIEDTETTVSEMKSNIINEPSQVECETESTIPISMTSQNDVSDVNNVKYYTKVHMKTSYEYEAVSMIQISILISLPFN